jgi:TonB family protein
LALSLALATSAVAKDFGEHGGYEVVALESTSETDPAACVMAEDDFEGPGGTRLRLFRYANHPELVAVTVDNYNWTAKNDEKYELSYRFDKYYYDRTASGTVDGNYHGFVAVFPYSDFMDTLAKSGHLHIYTGDTIVDKLSLEGSAAGRAAFERCWTYLIADEKAKARERARWQDIPKDPFSGPAPPPQREGGAAPIGALYALVSPDDYPASAVANHEQGQVRFLLSVAVDGRVTDCTILQSSGSAALDNTTCGLMLRRARFVPARDAMGHPVADTYESVVSWKLTG